MNWYNNESGKQMETVGQWLEKSIDCYRQILGVYRSIQSAVAEGSPAATLYGYIEQMQSLDQEARHNDARIWAKASETGAHLADQPQFSEWKTLLARVWEENQVMHRRLKAALAMLKDECSRIDDGKQGISGYRSGKSNAGRRININSV